MAVSLRHSGIGLIGDIPWGTHVCQFYHTKEDSLSLLIPYIKSGLEGNEACMWVTSGKISVADAVDALSKVVPDLEKRIRSGQLEILDPPQWYTKTGSFEIKSTLEGWAKKSVEAREKGFAGLRVTGDTSWLRPEDWAPFMEYEGQVTEAVDAAQMIALCSYNLDLLDASKVIDVVSTHQFCLIRQEDKWRLVENIERKRAIEIALAYEEKYRRVVENIPLGIYSALPDANSTSTLLSDKIEAITGYTPSEMMENPGLFSTMVHPDDVEDLWAKIAEHRRTKGPLKVEYRIVTKSRAVRWIRDEAQPVLDEAGKIIRIDGFIEDITERKSIEEALKRSEERFKLAQKAANTGSWDWNVVDGSLKWSDEIEPMFGFERGKFGGRYVDFLACLHPDDRKIVEDGVRACIDKGEPYDVEHRIIWPDGSIHWISEKGDVVRDKDGTAVRMLGVVRDITLKKKQEETINLLNKDLERRTFELSESNRELEAFTYSVSHDLRGPLRRIDGFSEILEKDYSKVLDENALRYLSRIRHSTKAMDQLIDDMLRLSRLNTAELTIAQVDIGSIAKEIIEGMARADPSRKVKTSVHGDFIVSGDSNLLRVALENLLGNAWKFTSKNAQATIELGEKKEDGRKVFFVKDNGIGFDMKHADRLFIPFQRFHNPEEFPGTGLGLAVVRRVVSRHGGRVWAESEPGKGATFYFTLN